MIADENWKHFGRRRLAMIQWCHLRWFRHLLRSSLVSDFSDVILRVLNVPRFRTEGPVFVCGVSDVVVIIENQRNGSG